MQWWTDADAQQGGRGERRVVGRGRLARRCALRQCTLLVGLAAAIAACAPPEQGSAPLALPIGDTATSDAATTGDATTGGGDGASASDVTTVSDSSSADGASGDDGAEADGSGSDAGAADGADTTPLDGAALYASQCAACHGGKGEGGPAGPALSTWHLSHGQLVARIAGSMPKGAPQVCDAACAEAIAAWMEASLLPPCALPPRRLRLLSRREWVRTVADLLPDGGGKVCATDVDCAVSSQSCVAAVCVDDPCGLQTFVLPDPAHGYSAAHVASAANGWAATPAAGGWPMVWHAKLGGWLVKQALQPGSWAYKFVVDGKTWLTDAANPDKVDDGYGGLNSVVTIACSGTAASAQGALLAQLGAAFPADARPSGYAFDQHAGAGVVSDVHVEQQLAAAKVLATARAPSVVASVGCAKDASATACSAALVAGLAPRALRRPLSAEEVQRYSALVQTQANASAGAAVLIRALLTSPHFWLRSELGAPAADGSYALDAWELASALAYTLTGSMPDAKLREAAASGVILSDTGLHDELDRLLLLPVTRDHLGDFARMWLGAERILTEPKSTKLFPDFSDALRASLAAEVGAFYSDLVLDSQGKVQDLMTSPWQWIDSLLAAHYGLTLPAGAGPGLHKVANDGKRAGVLGLGAVLSATAHSDQSSPIRRGLFVRTKLLCHELPPPPPNAGGVPDVDPNATTKERFAQHTADPFCASCHQSIDPVGFGFEHFDAVGKWRTLENGKPIDAAGDMVDVEAIGAGSHAPFADLAGLGKSLAGAQAAQDCHARWWWRFAVGTLEGPQDRCELATLATSFGQDGGDLRQLLRRVVLAPSFRRRAPPEAP